MNAVDPSPTAEQARDVLARVARDHRLHLRSVAPYTRCDCGWTGEHSNDWADHLAEEQAAALFRPGEKECETCEGMGSEHQEPYEGGDPLYWEPCPNPACVEGRVPTPPPILALVAERLLSELVEVLIGWGALTQRDESMYEAIRTALHEYLRAGRDPWGFDYADMREAVAHPARVVLPAPTEEP